MKATFFSIAALAATAFAAPTPDVGKAVGGVDDVVADNLGLGQLVGQVGNTAGNVAKPTVNTGLSLPIVDKAPIVGGLVNNLPVKRDIADTSALSGLLSGLLGGVTGHTDALNLIGQKVKAGDLTKEEGQAQAVSEIDGIHYKLTGIVTELTGTAGLTVLDGDVDTLLTTVVTLVTVVLKTVNGLIVILGLTPQLNSLLHSVFSLLAQIITLVTGLVTGLVPGLVAALSPLLAALGNGLLAPLLTPIVGVVAGLAAGGLLNSVL